MSLDSVNKWPSLYQTLFRRKFLFWIFSLAFAIEWVLLAFNVYSREDWFLENVLVLVFIGPSIWLYKKGHISIRAYVLLIIFLAFHSIGAHFTYSLVPYDEWLQKVLGISLSSLFGWQRNHYDRIVHFLWGLLLYVPLKEFIKNFTTTRGRSLVIFTLFSIIAGSTLYEIIEWFAAMVFGGDLGIAYVGTQGDVWDAQKDQVLAISGALVAMLFSNNQDY